MVEGVVIDDTGLFNDRVQECEDFYNFRQTPRRPGRADPYERLRQKTGPGREWLPSVAQIRIVSPPCDCETAGSFMNTSAARHDSYQSFGARQGDGSLVRRRDILGGLIHQYDRAAA